MSENRGVRPLGVYRKQERLTTILLRFLNSVTIDRSQHQGLLLGLMLSVVLRPLIYCRLGPGLIESKSRALACDVRRTRWLCNLEHLLWNLSAHTSVSSYENGRPAGSLHLKIVADREAWANAGSGVARYSRNHELTVATDFDHVIGGCA